jgi:citrate lyase subunit beta/citryl-CoA lyase/(S)-citramalyl-CoA lyase
LFERLPINVKIIPIIETPEAIENVERIAKVSDALMFGQVDIVASMYQKNDSYLAYARGRFAIACAQSEISAIDTAKIDGNIDLTNTSTFEQECASSKAEGFTAKAVIHPSQVQIVNKFFRISEAELDKYRTLIKHYEQNSEGFSLTDGLVVAPPFVAQAKMMLRLYCAKKQKSTDKM